MMIVLSVVFSRIMGMPTKDYAGFLFCGLLPWNFFSSTTLMSLHSIRNNARLFGQVPIPKYIFIISIACSNLFNLAVSVIPLILLIFFLKGEFHFTAFLSPLILLNLVMITVGISMILAVSNVFFDDTLHLSEVALQILYFLSPILYHRELLPDYAQPWIIFNPVFPVIESFRGLFFSGVLPEPMTYLTSLAGALVLLYIGLFIFKKTERTLLYHL
jgi:ABC-type polysaccharide/polyol phosphate export permease